MSYRQFSSTLIILLLSMLAGGFIAIQLGQDANWDLQNYHWYNPYSFLNHRLFFDFAPAQLQTYYNPLLDLINYFIINSFAPKWAGFTLGAIHGIAFFFLLKIAYILFENQPPIWRWFYILMATILGVTGVASYSQIGTTFNESYVTILILLAIYLYLRAIKSHKHVLYLLSGFFIGFVVGLKQTVICYAVGFYIAVFFTNTFSKENIYILLWMVLSSAFGLFATDGFWMLILYKNFHSPFFPLCNNIFHSPDVHSGMFSYTGFCPKNIISALFYPFKWLKPNTLVQEIPMADPRIAVALIFMIILLFLHLYKLFNTQYDIKNRGDYDSSLINFIFIFFITSYVVWLSIFAIYRYTIPLNFLSGIIIVYSCLKIFKLVKTKFLMVLVLTLFIFSFTLQSNWGRVAYKDHFFDVKVPALPHHSLVILFGDYPIAFLIPFFPKEIRFVGLFNNIVNLHNPAFFAKAINIIHSHSGPIFGIFQTETSVNEYDLKSYDLNLRKKPCEKITSNMGPNVLYICELRDRKQAEKGD